MPDGTAKFRLEPLKSLADYHNLREKDLNKIESIIEEKRDDFIKAWNRHFRV